MKKKQQQTELCSGKKLGGVNIRSLNNHDNNYNNQKPLNR